MEPGVVVASPPRPGVEWQRRRLRTRRLSVRDAGSDELADWDVHTVEAAGGHVLQSRAWAEHSRASGWSPRFLITDDGGRVLALTRPWRIVSGSSAYLPRGPVPGAPNLAPIALADRLVAVSAALATGG